MPPILSSIPHPNGRYRRINTRTSCVKHSQLYCIKQSEFYCIKQSQFYCVNNHEQPL